MSPFGRNCGEWLQPKKILRELLMKEQVTITTHPIQDTEIAKIIHKNLKDFNESILGPYEAKPFCIDASAENKVIGGINGDIFGKICRISEAWVHNDYRKLKLGTKLFKEVEEFAKQNNCRLIQLETNEFQAKGFYEKLGYHVIAVLPDNFISYTTYILRKEINYN